MKTELEKPIITFTSQEEWSIWLENNYNTSNGVWIRFYKKESGLKTFSYLEALLGALCYGWIDGQSKKYGEDSYIQKFTPRRKRSMWSKRNTEFVEQLIKEGRMKPAGLAEVEKARSDGRWDNAYASPANTVVPEDFSDALNKNKKAKDFFETINKTNKHAIIFQINSAKKEETRVRRIEKFITMLEQKKKLY